VSLILDALRKADAERERGSVPSLHSHPITPLGEERPSKPKSGTNWLWIAVGLSAGLLGAAAILVMVGRGAPRTNTPPVATAPAPASSTAPAATSTPAQSPASAPAPYVAPPPGAASPAPAPTASVAQPAPWTPPEERKPDERKASPQDSGNVAPVPVLGNMPPAQAPVYSREQLPPNIRAELPQFSIGGSIYSPVPTARSLIVNGQLFREKDRLNPDLTLEEIRLKAAIFSFRGYRFEVLF
jgi:general secretion pathway protein B